MTDTSKIRGKTRKGILIWEKNQVILAHGTFRFEFKAKEDWRISADARPLGRHLADVARSSISAAITQGVDPATGEPRPMYDGRRLGYDTGHLANDLKIVSRGSKVKSRVKIQAPADRAEWLEREAKRSKLGLHRRGMGNVGNVPLNGLVSKTKKTRRAGRSGGRFSGKRTDRHYIHLGGSVDVALTEALGDWLMLALAGEVKDG